VRSGVASDKEAFDLKKLVQRHHYAFIATEKKDGKEATMKTSESAHPIDDQQFAAYILTRTTGEEDHRAGKVLWVTPATRWDPLRNLSKPHRISQMLLVPTDIAISQRGNKRASSRALRRHVSGARLKINNEKRKNI